MRIKALCLAVFMSFFYLGSAQEESKVLFTIDGEEVYSSEFLRVYEKNKEIVVEEAGKGFDDYFDLFLDFKLKLKQARDQDLDTSSTYLSDLAKYREQLLQPYLQNSEALDELTQEAYQRTIVEVNASHILILLAPEALPLDSLKAYDRISEARTEILSGKEFEAVAKVYSEDPSVQQNGGNLGYFSAFDMVYPFENAAYETEIGGISNPFRTQFGFHIVKVVDKRKSPGEIQVSHIMVKTDSLNPDMSRQKIEEIYQSLEQGDDFARIAQEHSDDLSSSKKGGKLPKFGTGRMIRAFEDAAFSLENEGEYSKPFSTQFGWHILKLDKKYPIPPYDELKPRLEAKVKNSSRTGYVERSLAQKVGSDYSLVINMKLLNSLKELKDFEGRTDTILRIQERVFVGEDFYRFAESEKNKTVGELFDEFKNREIIEYYKDHLEDSNSEFAATYNEYKDGLLLFELLQKQIWDRSENDSVELENYFKQHRERYNWRPRAEVLIGSCTQKQKAEEVRRLLLKGRSAESIKEEINDGAIIHVLFSQGKLEEGSSKLPEGYTFEPGVSQIFEEGENQYTLIRVDRIYPETRKELKEARGEVLNDYQNHLEERWVQELREAYTVKINKRNYKELKTSLEN